MGYPLRIFSHPQPVTVEITRNTFQHRALMRPDPRLNERIIGALARAQQRFDVKLHGFIFLSTHAHLIATFADVRDMAGFMRLFSHKVSVEIGKLYEWTGSVFPTRYQAIELSQEPEVEWDRLMYLTRNSCKEGLVDSPLAWPGATSAKALTTGETLRGVWIDRTGLYKARGRGRQVTEEDFTEELELRLEPLPSLAHLSKADYRDLMRSMIDEVEEETGAMHRQAGTKPLGVAAILNRRPAERLGQIPRSPRPWFHARRLEIKQAIREALVQIVSAYREASRRLRNGDVKVRFPEGVFPPPLPFSQVSETTC